MRRKVVVIGGGPAGLTASIEMAKRGVEVLLIDENKNRVGSYLNKYTNSLVQKEHDAGIRGFNIGENLLQETTRLGRSLVDSEAVGF